MKAVIDTKYEHVYVDIYIINQIQHELKSTLWRNGSQFKDNEGLWSDEKSLNIMHGSPTLIDLGQHSSISQIISSISLKTDSKDLVLTLSDLIVPCNKISVYVNHSIPKKSLGEYFWPVLRPLSNSENNGYSIMILGSYFLKSFYVVIDTQTAQVGLANKPQQGWDISNIERINSSEFLDVTLLIVFTASWVTIFIFMISGCMEFYDLGEAKDQNRQDTTEHSSQSNSIDQRQQEEEDTKDPNELQEISNDVIAAIQYTQNDDGTMRVIDNLSGLVEELKGESSDKGDDDQ